MKKTLTAITMALVLGCSTAFANGGIIIGDRGIANGGTSTPCTAPRVGIIIGDRSGILGGLFTALEGIIIGDRGSAQCTTPGIIIGDRAGTGIIIGD